MKATLRSGSVGLVDGEEDFCDGDWKSFSFDNKAALAFVNFRYANAAQAHDDDGEGNRNADFRTLQLTLHTHRTYLQRVNIARSSTDLTRLTQGNRSRTSEHQVNFL